MIIMKILRQQEKNAYGTIASEKLKYKNKMTKYKISTNEQILETKLILYDNGVIVFFSLYISNV